MLVELIVGGLIGAGLFSSRTHTERQVHHDHTRERKPLHSIPATPRSPMRTRPAMRFSAVKLHFECPCGGTETTEMRLLKIEHVCSRERWT